MNWIEIENIDSFNRLSNEMKSLSNKPYILFKHSTRCSVSKMAYKMMENSWKGDAPIYLIKVVENRPVSNLVAEKYNIVHESPQVLVIRNGECIHDASHSEIDVDTLYNLVSSKPA